MKKSNRHIVVKWALLVLFAAYTSCISFFTHTHVVNHVTYVHSHPFKTNEGKQHTHTQNQLFLLDHLFHTQITSDIVPIFDLSDWPVTSRIVYTNFYEEIHYLNNPSTTFLRAPPAV